MARSVIPSGKALSTEVTGINLAEPLNAADVEFIKVAWSEHLVLSFWNKNLELTRRKRVFCSGR